MLGAGGTCEFSAQTLQSDRRGAHVSPASARASDPAACATRRGSEEQPVGTGFLPVHHPQAPQVKNPRLRVPQPVGTGFLPVHHPQAPQVKNPQLRSEAQGPVVAALPNAIQEAKLMAVGRVMVEPARGTVPPERPPATPDPVDSAIALTLAKGLCFSPLPQAPN